MKITALVLLLAFATRDPLGTGLGAASLAARAQSTRANQCPVPDVVGLDERTAASRLQQADLGLGRVAPRVARQPAGTVIAQQPSACSTRPANGRVDLVVSSGPRAPETPAPEGERRDGPSVGDIAVPVAIGAGIAVLGTILSRRDNLVEVPDLVTQPLAAAAEAVKTSRLRMGEVVRRETLAGPAGTIIEQVPAAGTRVPRNSTVNVGVSSGPPLTAVPDVTLKARQEAEALVTGAQLRVLVMNPMDGDTSGLIVESQVPEPGTRLRVGASVGITLRPRVQAGGTVPQPPTVAVPGVAGPVDVPPAVQPAVAVPVAQPPPAAPAAPAAPTAAPVPVADPVVTVAQPAPPDVQPIQAPAAGVPVTQVLPPPAVAVTRSIPVAVLVAISSSWPWLWLLPLLAGLLMLWRVRRPTRTKASGTDVVEVPPVIPRVTFVPRLDAGHQVIAIVDGHRGRTFSIALQVDAGIQRLQAGSPSRIVHMGAGS
jgi:beta-lactam-binding protein with PASTA domain